MQPEAPGSGPAASRLSKALSWVALGFALSPVLLDSVRHVVEEPWARYSIIFAVLAVASIARVRTRPAPSRWGHIWLAAALLIAIVGVGGNMTRLSRPAIPLGTIGLCQVLGLAPVGLAALSLWTVPPPNSFSSALTPDIQNFYLSVATSITELVGPDATVRLRAVNIEGQTLSLLPSDSGLPIAFLCSGLGWYVSLRRGERTSRRLLRTLAWGLAGFPIQALATLIAVAALSLGSASFGPFFLHHALWMMLATGGLALAHRTKPSVESKRNTTKHP